MEEPVNAFDHTHRNHRKFVSDEVVKPNSSLNGNSRFIKPQTYRTILKISIPQLR